MIKPAFGVSDTNQADGYRGLKIQIKDVEELDYMYIIFISCTVTAQLTCAFVVVFFCKYGKQVLSGGATYCVLG